jgi:hypothetical protein
VIATYKKSANKQIKYIYLFESDAGEEDDDDAAADSISSAERLAPSSDATNALFPWLVFASSEASELFRSGIVTWFTFTMGRVTAATDAGADEGCNRLSKEEDDEAVAEEALRKMAAKSLIDAELKLGTAN